MMEIAKFTVDETVDFVTEKLDMPELAVMVRDEHVDGEVLLVLDTTSIRTFLPSVTLGQCMKLFSRLKKFREQDVQAGFTTPPPNRPRSDLFQEHLLEQSPSEMPATSQATLRPEVQELEQSPLRLTCPSTLATEETEVHTTGIGQSTDDENPPHSPLTSSRRPEEPVHRQSTPPPKNFPIDRIAFCPAAMRMIETGEVTALGKTKISDAVVSLIQKYSTSEGYADISLKRHAATALVQKFPKLDMGLAFTSAVEAWHRCFTQKLINWRKRNKVSDPRIDLEKRRFQNRQLNPSIVEAESTPRKQRRIASPVSKLNDEEIAEQQLLKEILQKEMSKPVKTRNQRLIETESMKSFPLRRQAVLTDSLHVKDVLRDWPALRLESVVMTEFTQIESEVANIAEFSCRLKAITPQLMKIAREKASYYAKSHPLAKILSSIPWTEDTDPDYNSDANIIGAVVALPYILHTTTKKDGTSHQYVLDISPHITTNQDVENIIPDRHQPFIQVMGATQSIDKILVYVDKHPVTRCTDMYKALYILMSFYYILNVEYSIHVYPTLEFLQIACLGLSVKRPQTRVRDLLKKLTDVCM